MLIKTRHGNPTQARKRLLHKCSQLHALLLFGSVSGERHGEGVRCLATHNTVLPRCCVSNAPAIGPFGGHPQDRPAAIRRRAAPGRGPLTAPVGGRPCCQPRPQRLAAAVRAVGQRGWRRRGALFVHSPGAENAHRAARVRAHRQARRGRHGAVGRATGQSWGGPGGGGGGGRGEQRGGEVTDPRRRRRRCYPSRRCCHLTTGRVAASPEDTGNLLPLTC